MDMIFENSFGELVDVLIGNDLDKSFSFTSIEDLPQKIREIKLEKILN